MTPRTALPPPMALRSPAAPGLPTMLALLTVLALLSGCDDMTVQPKAGAWSPAATLVMPAQDTVAWDDAEQKPPALTLALLQRGQQRFRIDCTPCHSELGDGHGMVVQRGFPAPPSYHIDRLRQAPTQHFYDVMTNGYGAMYSFAGRVSPPDRWAIAAYIRALQLSQHPPAAAVQASP
jgi:mono/diheme cytochrome c family protein